MDAFLSCPRFESPSAEAEPALLSLGFGGAAAELMLALPSAQTLREVWPVTGPVQCAQDAEMRRSAAGAFCMFHALLRDGEPLDTGYARLYRTLFTQALALGYPHLVRLWNYFPAINQVEAGLDGYQRFCLGRAQALDRAPTGIDRLLPAATAIGTPHGAAHLIALASRFPGRHFSNPRQLDPLDYPQDYGPRSPNFARATQIGGLAFISGTASIVGHASLHPGQTLAQTQEILLNLRQLLAQIPNAHLCQMKVYLRDLAEQAAVRALLTAELGSLPTLYLGGAICRPELQLEIEAVAYARA